MKKNIVCYAAIIVCIVVVFTACDYYDELEAYDETAPLADTIRTLPFLVDKITMEVVDINADRARLRITNHSDMTIEVAPDYIRRQHVNYPGPFTTFGSFHIDFFDGQYWRLLTSYPNTRPDLGFMQLDGVPTDESSPATSLPIIIGYWANILPGEHLTFNYCLALQPIPKEGIEHYRIVLDVFPSSEHVTQEMRQALRDYQQAGGDVIFYNMVGLLRHAIVAEFYWNWD